MIYVGLTDDPDKRKEEHGNPHGWWQCSFPTEEQARKWKKTMAAIPGIMSGYSGKGWRYGYTYTITFATKQ